MNAMDKRLKEHIDELIRLYDEARTTDEQERDLADFFSQPHDTLPEEWERYAALFTAFAGSESLFSEAELEEMTAPLPHRSRRVWPWTLGAAAAIALLIGLFLHQPHTTEAPDYLAIAEQPIQNTEELGITTVDSALMGRIAGLDIVPNSTYLGDSKNVMRLGGDCPPPAESVPAHSDSNKIERMDGIKDVMVAKAEAKIEPAPTISPSDEVRIGQTQMKKTAPQLTFTTPTLDVDKVFTPKDSTSQSLVPKLDIVFNSSELGNTNNAMRLRGGSNAELDSLLTLLCVSVNGELFLDSLNFLATLHKDEIRDYFLSQGKVFDDIDIWLTKEDSTIISKYGWLPKSKGKHMLMEITLKEEGYLAESEIFPDFDKASQENSMEFCGLGESPQVEIMTLAEESPDDWVIVEQPIPDVDKPFMPKDSSLMQFTGALNNSPDTAISKSRGTLLSGYQRREEETIPAYVVSVNGELLPDSMNYLATLSLNKIREYFLSRGEVVEDFDYRVVKDETERQKYIERAKGKHTIVELRIKTKPLKLDMTAADSSLIGRRAGVDTVSAHSDSIGSAHMKEKIKVPDSLSVK